MLFSLGYMELVVRAHIMLKVTTFDSFKFFSAMITGPRQSKIPLCLIEPPES